MINSKKVPIQLFSDQESAFSGGERNLYPVLKTKLSGISIPPKKPLDKVAKVLIDLFQR